MAWFAVHVVLRVKYQEPPYEPVAVWENCVVVQSENHALARASGAKVGLLEAEASREGMAWEGRPARWEFVGVRKVQSIDASEFEDGLEISHIEYEVENEEVLAELVSGAPVRITYLE